jgi:hypothetical protein
MGDPSVPLLTDDSQIGANLRVCADEEDRADFHAGDPHVRFDEISAADRERLGRLVRDRNTPQKVVWRARILLLAGDGLTAEGIAGSVGKSLLTVRRWRRRYVSKGVDGLKDATRRSRVKPVTPERSGGDDAA